MRNTADFTNSSKRPWSSDEQFGFYDQFTKALSNHQEIKDQFCDWYEMSECPERPIHADEIAKLYMGKKGISKAERAAYDEWIYEYENDENGIDDDNMDLNTPFFRRALRYYADTFLIAEVTEEYECRDECRKRWRERNV